MTKSEKAEKNYSTGLNCGQAVLAAFHENAAINEEQAIKIGTGMGAGLCSGDLCGAVNAAVAAISLKYGGQSGEEKMMVMQKTKKYLDEFKKWGGSTNCINLKRESGKSCKDIVKFSGQILENII